MSSPVEKIKERLNIADVISSYTKLEKAGANFKARCPFHNEKTPSFFVSPARQSYYCFGCGAKGDIFTFVEEFEGLDFLGALKLLAARAGVELTAGDQSKRSEKEKLYELMEIATRFFIDKLASHEPSKKYLAGRGLTKDTIETFRLGYAPHAWHELGEYLRNKEFSEALIEQAGLAKKTDRGFYDRFRGRIMFPIMDTSGRVIAFSGRLLVDEENAPKYLNSPQTPLFDKSSVLYGLDRAKESIRKSHFSILVEGQMDLLLSHQAGFTNTVASSGTAFDGALTSPLDTVTNLGLLKRLSENIVIALDGDAAGARATLTVVHLALSLGMDVKVAHMPEGMDPADTILRSKEEWKKIITDAMRAVDFYLQDILSKKLNDRQIAVLIRDRLLALIRVLPSAIVRDQALRTISAKTSISEAALLEDLEKIKDTAPNVAGSAALPAEKSRPRKDAILDRLLGVIFWQESAETPRASPAELVKRAQSILDDAVWKDVYDTASPRRSELIFAAEAWYSASADITEDLEELLANLEEEHLSLRLTTLMRTLHEAEESRDPDRALAILEECQDISKRIHAIKARRFLEK